mmetsp:Transcript_25673/g.68169  ORF Transcript_25673/g.68169 Transcript_25673/m.68169 type:complete len:441 (+) Transcript_25673:616-1938(+)
MRAHAKVQRHQQHHSALQDLVRHASGVLATASREDAGPRTYVPRTICFRAVSVRYRLLEHEGHAQKVHHTKHAHEDERKGGMGHTLAWKPTDDERLRDNVGEKQPKHGLSDHSERIPNRRRDACVVQCRGPRIAGRRQVEAHVVECELDAALKACDEAADQQPRGGLLEQAVDHDAIPDDHEERLHLQGHAALVHRKHQEQGQREDRTRPPQPNPQSGTAQRTADLAEVLHGAWKHNIVVDRATERRDVPPMQGARVLQGHGAGVQKRILSGRRLWFVEAHGPNEHGREENENRYHDHPDVGLLWWFVSTCGPHIGGQTAASRNKHQTEASVCRSLHPAIQQLHRPTHIGAQHRWFAAELQHGPRLSCGSCGEGRRIVIRKPLLHRRHLGDGRQRQCQGAGQHRQSAQDRRSGHLHWLWQPEHRERGHADTSNGELEPKA